MKKTPIDKLSATIEKVLAEYADDVTGITKEAVTTVTKAGVKAIKAEARSALKTGDRYIKGWTSSFENGRFSRQGTIYNKDVPGLPHLLEFGHVTTNGKRVFAPTPAHPHIAVVEEKIAKDFADKIKRDLQ